MKNLISFGLAGLEAKKTRKSQKVSLHIGIYNFGFYGRSRYDDAAFSAFRQTCLSKIATEFLMTGYMTDSCGSMK